MFQVNKPVPFFLRKLIIVSKADHVELKTEKREEKFVETVVRRSTFLIISLCEIFDPRREIDTHFMFALSIYDNKTKAEDKLAFHENQ